MVFMNSQNFGKIGWKIPFFWQKMVIFAEIRACRFQNKFRRKINQVLGKWSNWPKSWYKCTLGYLLQLQRGIFGYFAFLQFYGCRNAPRGRFLGKIVNFYFGWLCLVIFSQMAIFLTKWFAFSRFAESAQNICFFGQFFCNSIKTI